MSEGHDEAFTSLLRALVTAQVEFVLIGGWALPVHGAGRTTFDVDVVPSPDRDNLQRLANLLVEIEAHAPGSDPQFPPLGVEALSSGATVKCLTRHGDLHIVQGQKGVPRFAELRQRALAIEVEGVRFLVCSYEDLIAMKSATGRPQDEIDITDLRRARGELE